MKCPLTRTSLLAFVALCALLAPPLLHAGTVTWNDAGTDWFDDANWDNGGHPGDGDHAAIPSGGVLLTNQTAQLSSLTMAGGTLTFRSVTYRSQRSPFMSCSFMVNP